MPTLTFTIAPDGLRLPVVVYLDGGTLQSLRARGVTPPPPTEVRGLIDTGTLVTAVSAALLKGLGLVPFAGRTTQTATGPAPVSVFKASLWVGPLGTANAPPFHRLDWTVTDLPDIDVLIGMDVVRALELSVNGPKDEFVLTY